MTQEHKAMFGSLDSCIFWKDMAVQPKQQVINNIGEVANSSSSRTNQVEQTYSRSCKKPKSQTAGETPL